MRAGRRYSILPLYGIEGINSFGAAFYFNYVFFFLRHEFHMSPARSLAAAALHGGIYTVMSRWAGLLAQRHGYFTTFRYGNGVVALALGLSSLGATMEWVQWVGLVGWTIGISLTWPALQALVSDGASRLQIARRIGVYNLVWSGLAGVANFVGGGLYDGLGSRSIFWIPMSLALGLVGASWWVERGRCNSDNTSVEGSGILDEDSGHSEASPALNARFLNLARVANPFAYVAINTVVPMIPEIATHLGLSTTQSGWVSSVWMFGRWATFAFLWRYLGWHYRLGWLMTAYVGVIAGFLLIQLAPSLGWLILGQGVFGYGIGLVYYSSLFYSMDAGEKKGEHGGLHEAAIGLGCCVGPGVSSALMTLWPGAEQATAWALAALIGAGGVALVKQSQASAK